MGLWFIKIVNTLHRAINRERDFTLDDHGMQIETMGNDEDSSQGRDECSFSICKSMLIYTRSLFLFTFHNTSELWTYNISVTCQFHRSKTFWFYLHQNFLSSSSTNKRVIKRNPYSSSTQPSYVYGIKHCTSWLGERILEAVKWCVILSHLLFPLFIHTPLSTRFFHNTFHSLYAHPRWQRDNGLTKGQRWQRWCCLARLFQGTDKW